MRQATTQGPLAGVRVVDLTSVLSGPAAMGTLADQGADVIKVEPPAGDIMRGRGTLASISAGFVSCNRGKRSIVLDLKQTEATEVLWELIASADVVAQNFRPGAVERLGFGADVVRARYPRVIYLSISGVGESGPYAGKRVYDPVVQALSGLADIQADPQTGRPRMVRTLIADKTTAIYAAQAVSAALFARERTGEGQHIRLSMLDTMVSYLWPEGMAPFASVADDTQSARASKHDMIFPTADGYITVGAVSDKEWHGLCAALGRPEWLDDPRFRTGALRAQNRQERLELVEQALGVRDTAQVIAALEAADVPCAPVHARRQVIDDPQVIANSLVYEVDQPGIGVLRQARPAARFEGTPAEWPSLAPCLGEHTEEILAELGYESAQIAAMCASGVASAS
ncbi:MAG: CoA transferase [Gammaproteobacteria bacterium]|nr:CoA transferase [Gammaproteobacteria bacterium]